MNAVADNHFTRALKSMGDSLPQPKSILMISAHWVSGGTLLQSSEQPKTIHDFGGFPKELYQIQYPAHTSPDLLHTLSVKRIGIKTEEWGLDHGAWSVLRHMYPAANIPVVPMSLDRALSFEQHYDVGKRLDYLREQGVLIIASGNIVHNLKLMDWSDKAPVFDWAQEFDLRVKNSIEKKDFESLINILQTDPALTKLAHPSYEHYIPLLYILGASDSEDRMHTVYEGMQNASISMRSFILG